MENPFNTPNIKPKRSTLLIVLVVLTLLNNSYGLFVNARQSLNVESAIIKLEEALDTMEDSLDAIGGGEGAFANIFSGSSFLLERQIEVLDKYGLFYFILLMLVAIGSIAGALLMLKLNKLGFHLYASAQVAALLIPLIFGLTSFSNSFLIAMNVFGILLTALFIWLYARELKIFNKVEETA